MRKLAFFVFCVCFIASPLYQSFSFPCCIRNLVFKWLEMFLKVTPLQMEKHNVILAKLKSEMVQARDEVLKLKGAVPKGMI